MIDRDDAGQVQPLWFLGRGSPELKAFRIKIYFSEREPFVHARLFQLKGVPMTSSEIVIQAVTLACVVYFLAKIESKLVDIYSLLWEQTHPEEQEINSVIQSPSASKIS